MLDDLAVPAEVLDAARELEELLLSRSGEEGSRKDGKIFVRELRALGERGHHIAPSFDMKKLGDGPVHVDRVRNPEKAGHMRCLFDVINAYAWTFIAEKISTSGCESEGKVDGKDSESASWKKCQSLLQNQQLESNQTSASFVRVTRYARDTTGHATELREHCDSSLFTIIFPSEVPGLEAHRGDRWLTVANDKAHAAIGTDFPSAEKECSQCIVPDLHRVRCPESGPARTSLCFFVRADPTLLGARSEFDFLDSASSDNGEDDDETILPRNRDWSSLRSTPFLALILIGLFDDFRDVGAFAGVCRRWWRATHSARLWQSAAEQLGLADLCSAAAPQADVRQVVLGNLFPRLASVPFLEFPGFRSSVATPNFATPAASVKLVCVGDSGAGKHEMFRSYYKEAGALDVDENCSFNISLPGASSDANLGVWLTSGREEYDRLRPLSYPPTDIFVFVFSLASRESFEAIEVRWHPEISRHCPGVRRLLVGAKADLKERCQDPVTSEEAQVLAQRLGFDGYFETCAFRSQGVDSVFEFASRVVIQRAAKGKKREKCAVQ